MECSELLFYLLFVLVVAAPNLLQKPQQDHQIRYLRARPRPIQGPRLSDSKHLLLSVIRDLEKTTLQDFQRGEFQIKEAMDKIHKEAHSISELMQLGNEYIQKNAPPLGPLQYALDQLRVLRQDIQNANTVQKYLSLVIGQLSSSNHAIRTTSAWVVGKAAQKDPRLQNQFLELGALPKLMIMVKSSFIEEAIEAVFAISEIVRNNHNATELFYSQGGGMMIQGILSNTTADAILHSIFVSVGDLAESPFVYNTNPLPFRSNCALVNVLFNLTASDDLDLKEKVLLAVKNFLRLPSTNFLVLDGFCGLKGALERMRLQLQQLIQEENDNEYAIDVDGLCKEVNLIYLEKLTKTRGVNSVDGLWKEVNWPDEFGELELQWL